MKKLFTFVLFLAVTLPAAAVDEGQTMYTGGTIPSLKSGVIGRLDTTSETALEFEYNHEKFPIPYADIVSYEYTTEVTHHLGVLPAVSVALLSKRKHKHFFEIVYHDADLHSHVAVFEVAKQSPRTLLPVLRARALNVCKRYSYDIDGRQPACDMSVPSEYPGK